MDWPSSRPKTQLFKLLWLKLLVHKLPMPPLLKPKTKLLLMLKLKITQVLKMIMVVMEAEQRTAMSWSLTNQGAALVAVEPVDFSVKASRHLSRESLPGLSALM